MIDPEERIKKAKTLPAMVLAGDFVSAVAVRDASGVPVALAPKEGDLKAAIKSLRARRPDCDVVAAGDASFVQRARAEGIAAVKVEKPRKPRPARGAEETAGVPDGAVSDRDREKTGIMQRYKLRAKLAPLVGDAGFEAWTELRGAPWADPGNAPWLKQNGVRGFGLKLAPDGGVAMPLRNAHGRLHEVKFISPDGASRRVRADGEAPVLMHLIDPARQVREDTVIVAGDYLSGAAIHKATRLPVAVAEEPDKTMDVACALRKRYPDSKLVIAVDREQAETVKEKAGEIRVAVAAPPEKTKSFAKMAGDPDSIRDVLARPAGDAVWLRWREAEPVEKEPGGRPQELPTGLPVENLRRGKHGEVLVPLTDASGRVWGLHALDRNSETAERLASGSPKGLMFEIGGKEPNAKGDAIVADDLASAAAIHQATGRRVLCAFEADNLKASAEALRRKHPKAEIVVAAPDGKTAREAAEAVNGRPVAPPPAKDGKPQPTFGELWRDPSRRHEVKRHLVRELVQGRARGAERGIGR